MDSVAKAIGAAGSSQDVLGHPEQISRTVLEQRLDSTTALEILSLQLELSDK